MIALQELVKGDGFLAHIDREVFRELTGKLHAHRVRKGQIVLVHRSDGGDVFIVAEGKFEVLIYSRSGREVFIRQLDAGDIFGELAALDGGHRTATVAAISNGLLAAMSRADFLATLRRSPEAALWLASHLAAQMRAMTERCFELSALNVASRLHCELLRLCFKFGLDGKSARIAPSPTHEELANRIGSHREAVTRELRDLARQNIVRQTRRCLEILDAAKLAMLVHRSRGSDLDIQPTAQAMDAVNARRDASKQRPASGPAAAR